MAVREPEREMPSEIMPPGWPRGAGYAHALSARGRVVSLSGQVGWDPRTNAFHAKDLPGQAEQALRNIAAILDAAGCGVADVVRLTWYVTDREAYIAARRDLGNAYRAVFGKHYPAMSVVVVAALIEAEALVEIEATAVIADG